MFARYRPGQPIWKFPQQQTKFMKDGTEMKKSLKYGNCKLVCFALHFFNNFLAGSSMNNVIKVANIREMIT